MRANTLDAKLLEIDGQSASGGSNPNLFINGQFDIWQRATSATAATYCCADRWIFYDGSDGAATVSRQTFSPGQTDVPKNPKYYAQYQMTTQATSGSPGIHQRIENVITVHGEQLTFSFYAKLASGTLVLTPQVRQDFGNAGSSAVVTNYTSQTITVTSTWAKYIITLDVPSISGKTISGNDDYVQVGFDIPLSSGTFTMSLANMKAEKGSVATPFISRSYGEELALCQRYFWKGTAANSVNYRYAGGANTIYEAGTISFPVQLRANPTTAVENTPTYANCSSVVLVSDTYGLALRVTTSAANAYRAYSGIYSADAEL
jgi:hypothetical protein